MLRLRDVLSTGASTLLSGGLAMLTSVLAARLLGPEQNGHFAQFGVILNLVCAGLGLGLGPATTFFVASGRASPGSIARLNLKFLGVVLCLMALLLMTAVLTGTMKMLEASVQVPGNVVAAGVLGGVALLAVNQAAALHMGRHDYWRANLLAVLRTGAPLPLVVAAASVQPTGSAASVAQALVVAAVAAFAWASAGTGSRAPATDRPQFRALMAYGILAYFAHLLHYVAMRGLLLGLSYFATPAVVGFASLALILVEALLLVPSAIGQLLFPQSSNKQFDRSAMESVLRLSLLIALVAAVGVFLLGPVVVHVLLGVQYADVGTALMHLAPTIVLLTVPRILSPVLAGRGQPQIPLIGALLSLVTGIALALWLMPRWGLIGTMWVVNAVSLCTAVVALWGYCDGRPRVWLALLVPRRQELVGWWQGLQRVIGRGRGGPS